MAFDDGPDGFIEGECQAMFRKLLALETSALKAQLDGVLARVGEVEGHLAQNARDLLDAGREAAWAGRDAAWHGIFSLRRPM